MEAITAIFTLAFAMGRAISDSFKIDEESDDISKEQQALTREYKRQLGLLELNFADEKESANKEADKKDRQAEQLDKEALLKDKSTTLNEKYVSSAFNNEYKQLQAEQASSISDYNKQSIAIGESEGDQLSTLAASGTRAGGSLSAATELKTNMLQSEFQNAQNITRLNNELKTYNLFNNLNKNVNDIQENRYNADLMRDNADMYRTDALDLRNSYLEGGSKWKLNEHKKKYLTEAYETNYNELQEAWDTLNSGSYRFRRAATSFFGGANEGMKTGKDWSTVLSNAWGNS